jgi:hypothetical protein
VFFWQNYWFIRVLVKWGITNDDGAGGPIAHKATKNQGGCGIYSNIIFSKCLFQNSNKSFAPSLFDAPTLKPKEGKKRGRAKVLYFCIAAI